MEIFYGVSVKPFSTGKEMHEWCKQNCDWCKIYCKCHMLKAMLEAYTGIEKNIPICLAKKMGWNQHSRKMGSCPIQQKNSMLMNKANLRVFDKYEKWKKDIDF